LAAGRKPDPTLGIMDGQSVKTSERGRSRLRWPQAGEGTEPPSPGRCAWYPDHQSRGASEHLGPGRRLQIACRLGAALADNPNTYCGCCPQQPQAHRPTPALRLVDTSGGDNGRPTESAPLRWVLALSRRRVMVTAKRLLASPNSVRVRSPQHMAAPHP
jgi:hypothetical protein